MRRLIPLVFLASSLPAQYFDLAVTDDGRLYFSTPLSISDVNNRLKVYRLTNDRPELFAAGTPDNNPFGNTAGAPLVSGDGSITGWALTLPCSGGSCGLSGLPRVFYQLQGAGIDNLPANALQISRNGRFLATSTFDGHVRLIELSSQLTSDLGQSLVLAGPQSVANNGGVLMLDVRSSDLLYRPPDGDARPLADRALSGVLSPASDRVAYERTRDGRLELVLDNIVIAAAPPPSPGFRYQPRFANDGTLLYVDPDGQPMIVPLGGAPRRLATVEAGVLRSIISGDGRIAWLASLSGQLLRVRIPDNAVDEVVPGTPYLAAGGQFAFPGSVIRFSGTGVKPTTHFQIDDVSLPLSAIGDAVAYVQIPWEYPARQQARSLVVQGENTPFHQRFDFTPLDRPTITFERELFSLKAAHQDFRGILTAADPARPGETIHIFARNLGPVDRPVATGETSPNPPARVTTPMACYLFELEPDGTPVRAQGLVVPFAGLSAGMVGIYHIDATIPADWKAKQAYLQCQMDSGGNLFHGDSARIDVAVDVR